MQSKKILLVGSYSPERGNEPEKIDRDYYRQGWIFKDEDAFQNRPDDVCYIPELSDEKYTRNDILKILAGDEELAKTMFKELDWQHPESLLEDWKANGEIAWCPHCIKFLAESDHEEGYDGCKWEDVNIDCESETLKELALYPGEPEAYCYIDSTEGEYLPFCGGIWNSTSSAGVFYVYLDNPRTHASGNLGFRSAYFRKLKTE